MSEYIDEMCLNIDWAYRRDIDETCLNIDRNIDHNAAF